jgi:flagellar motor switch protein FliN/FliY
MSEEVKNPISMIGDVGVTLAVELGRTKKTLQEILQFSEGTIVELDKLAGAAVDVLGNGKLIAKGEVIVIDENFGVRITEVLGAKSELES